MSRSKRCTSCVFFTFVAPQEPLAVAVEGEDAGSEGFFDALALPLIESLGDEKGGADSRQSRAEPVPQHVFRQAIDRGGISVQVSRAVGDELIDVGRQVLLTHVKRRELQFVVDGVELPEHARLQVTERHAAKGCLASPRRVTDPTPMAMDERGFHRLGDIVHEQPELVPPVVTS